MNQEIYLPYLVLAFIIFVSGLFFFFIWNSGRLHPSEKNKIPEYTERCGGRFGALNLTYPFVRITLYDSFLIIGHLRKILIEYKDIVRIDQLVTGIDIITKTGERPVIWTGNKDKIIKLINYRKQLQTFC